MIEPPLSFTSKLAYNVCLKGAPLESMPLLDRMDFYKIPAVSIACINKSNIRAAAYGFLDSRKTIPCTHNTLFQAASISKMVTALGVLKLVQQEVLSLDEDIDVYLKTWHLPKNSFTTNSKVTLRTLLSHTAGTTVSGFHGYSIDAQIPALTQILDGQQPANNEPVRIFQTPGSKFKYSGGGTCIVQKIIEDQTNTPFHTWIKDEILDPLGMSASTFQQPLPEQLAKSAARGYSNGIEVNGNWHIYPEQAAAGLWSTPSDLATLGIFLHSKYQGNNDSLINSDLIKEMLSQQTLINGQLYSGLGSFIHKTSNNFIFEHSGGNCGFSSLLHMHNESGTGVAIMMPGELNAWYLKQEILNALASVYHWTERKTIYKSDQLFNVAAYKHIIGKYESVDNPEDIAEIFAIDNDIYFKLSPDAFPIQLHLEKTNQFFSREEDQTFAFKQGENGWELIIDYHTDQIWGQQSLYTKLR